MRLAAGGAPFAVKLSREPVNKLKNNSLCVEYIILRTIWWHATDHQWFREPQFEKY
jgi:hypothetical protein